LKSLQTSKKVRKVETEVEDRFAEEIEGVARIGRLANVEEGLARSRGRNRANSRMNRSELQSDTSLYFFESAARAEANLEVGVGENQLMKAKHPPKGWTI
jgi:hypothetical protein